MSFLGTPKNGIRDLLSISFAPCHANERKGQNLRILYLLPNYFSEEMY
jgi:hypothetical protein